ncbi:DUF11 domain-containing protein [Alcanivorax sp. VBW004]|uniref:beta strand repeat-containing protein n=1 Tax=Alcanivorax sp. VBW004 TaxID=1287708 RepID=UPI0012BC9067|nr:DUF11 domain-containing protein [Alcanivorax sp. VBW004]MTT51604.1 DUF11 domain-containing protein [Alcanivorax sp. VBW004]
MKHAFNKGVLSSKMAASLVSGGLLFAAGQAWALTDAGTDIKNKATVTYEDANGNSYSAQSNEAVVTVAEVYAGTLENDGNKSGAPGETVYFSHTLKNTGNATDTFTLDGLNGAGAAGSYQVFIDANGNGQPDAGESAATSVSVDAGDQVELILAVPVPSGTAAGATIDGTLLVRSTRGDGSFDANDGGLVQDIGANDDDGDYDSDGVNGADGNDTNSDQVTVTTDAVLVTTKAASVDLTANTITYTLTVKNNGGRAATDVNIYDAVPANAAFVDILSVNGLLASNDDTYEDNAGLAQDIPTDATTMYAPATLTTVDESELGVDLDGNGSLDSDIPGILLTDKSLGVNTTVSIVYQVSFDPATAGAGTEIKNTFAAQGDLDNDPATTEDAVKSNTVTTVIGQTYAVDADDTEIAPDTTNDDVFNVASAASGAVVDFKHTITNNGNGDDVFELSVDTAGSTFPAGTTYSFWNAAGTVQITDTNGDGNPDTGSLAPGATNALNITVKADLPADINGAVAPYSYTLTATSAGKNDESDDTQGVLAAITAANVDIANSATAIGLGDSADDADEYMAGTPITTNSAAAGATTSFSLFVANESGNPQSYLLGSALPSGWSVVFKEVGIDTDGNGTLDNTTNADASVTATPNLPGGAVYHYTAEVKVSSNVAQAEADYTGADAVDGAGSATSPTDGDGDYPVTFTVVSASDSGINDSKLDAVDVVANRDISITPDGANQVQPGGNVDYQHVLSNDGNSTETVELSAANSNAPDWTNTTQLYVDTNNDGTPDAYRELSQIAALATAGQLWVRDQAGNPVQIGVADADGDNAPELTLEAGEKVELQVTVFAPGTAALGTQDTLNLTAANTDAGAGATASATATDVTDVILGQVRLDKAAGVDADCSCNTGSAEALWTPDSGFAASQTTKVEPLQCVIWNLTATNEGAATAKNVTITDETTPYTSFLTANSDNNSVANSGTDPEVKWEIGDLPAGDSATAQFCVRVN